MATIEISLVETCIESNNVGIKLRITKIFHMEFQAQLSHSFHPYTYMDMKR
jgi:hypothetical protein